MFMDVREKYKVQILHICTPQQVTCAYNQKSNTENNPATLALVQLSVGIWFKLQEEWLQICG